MCTLHITNKSVNKVFDWFQYRCIGGRYIDLVSMNSKSLLNDESTHEDHIHIAFNKPLVTGFPRFENIVYPTFDLDDINFKISDDLSSMIVEPKDFLSFLEYGIFVRLQQYPESDNVFDKVKFEEWLPPSPLWHLAIQKQEKYGFAKSLPADSIRYLYVTFAHLKSGGCIERKVILQSGVLSL